VDTEAAAAAAVGAEGGLQVVDPVGQDKEEEEDTVAVVVMEVEGAGGMQDTGEGEVGGRGAAEDMIATEPAL
jgi:hypothetical protein